MRSATSSGREIALSQGRKVGADPGEEGRGSNEKGQGVSLVLSRVIVP